MYKKYFMFCVLILFLTTCRKNKLVDEREVYIGKWKWAYSIWNDNNCNNSTISDLKITPFTEKKDVVVEFHRSGKVINYFNGEKRVVYDIRIDYSETRKNPDDFPWAVEAVILSGEFRHKGQDFYFSHVVAGDTMRCYEGILVPHGSAPHQCKIFQHYFSRIHE